MRPPLLAAGVKLCEIKRWALAEVRTGRKGAGGRSSSSLHAKTFAVDERRMVVGLFNVAPHSALLTTEMGLVIDNPGLARNIGRLFIGRLFDDAMPRAAGPVRLAANGQTLDRIERTPEGGLRHGTEPGTSTLRRLGVGLMSVLPIKALL